MNREERLNPQAPKSPRSLWYQEPRESYSIFAWELIYVIYVNGPEYRIPDTANTVNTDIYGNDGVASNS